MESDFSFFPTFALICLWDANNAKRGQPTPEKLKMEDTLCTAETAFPPVADFLFQP
jgi:hypothetical protein